MAEDTIKPNGGKFRHHDDAALRAKAMVWLERNMAKVAALFENAQIRDFVFEPFKQVFDIPGNNNVGKIKTVITLVALVNMVLAGLPGKMGVGVVVSMGLEAFMAYKIAMLVGIRLEKPADVWKYLSLVGSTGLIIIYVFKALLGFGYSAFSAVIPGVNPLILAELFTTNLFGIMVWTGFEEARQSGSFAIPKRLFRTIGKQTVDLFKFQYETIKNAMSPGNIKTVGRRAKDWLTGNILDEPRVRGELLVPLAFLYLRGKEFEKLEGPIGQEFIQAIRDRMPDLKDASLEQIADAIGEYDLNPASGMFVMVKGKLFERLVERAENTDADSVFMRLHTDESHPGSDAIQWNSDTGETLEISIKASENIHYLENALIRYPEFPLVSTTDHDSTDQLVGMLMTDSQLEDVTQDNFDALLSGLDRLSVAGASAGGVTMGAVVALWPFTAAYLRGRIGKEQLSSAFERVLGEAGIALAARISWGVIMGAVFAWFILAKGVMQIAKTQMPKGREECSPEAVRIRIDMAYA